MKLEFSGQIFEKHSNTKFNENPSSESRVVPCGRTWCNRWSHCAILRNRVETNIDTSIANPSIAIPADECLKFQIVPHSKHNPSRMQ